jgi:general secretion pathway protein G
VEKPSRGVTIVERLTVAVSITLLILLVVVQVGGRCERRVSLTAARMKQVQGVLQLFKMDHGRNPESLQDLVRPPSYVDPRKWPAEGYLQEPAVDEWGRPFLYRVPGKRGPFDIISWGEDGKEGGEGPDADLWNSPPR